MPTYFPFVLEDKDFTFACYDIEGRTIFNGPPNIMAKGTRVRLQGGRVLICTGSPGTYRALNLADTPGSPGTP